MRVSLEKSIKNYILPKYPMIKDFDVSIYYGDIPYKTFISYYVEGDKQGFITVYEEFKEIEKRTQSLFKMINDGEHVLREVFFKSLNDR